VTQKLLEGSRPLSALRVSLFDLFSIARKIFPGRMNRIHDEFSAGVETDRTIQTQVVQLSICGVAAKIGVGIANSLRIDLAQ
jgi:hypothetical protein